MTAGWKLVPFEHVVRSRGSGASGLPTSEWQKSGTHPVIGQGAQEIEGWTDRSDLLLSIPSGVVLYGGHTRRAKHVDRPFVPGPNVKILEPVQGLDSRFLFHYLTYLPIESKGYADHFPLVRKASVPVPIEDEQRRIVAILDDAFEAIASAKANTEKNVQNARDLFASFLRAALADVQCKWHENTLENLCVIGDGNHSANYPTKDELVESGVPFIRSTNLVAGRISGTDMRFLSPRKHAQLKKGHLKAGDILITNRGEIGKTALVDDAYDGSNVNSQIAWLRCRDMVNNRFLFHVLNSDRIQSHFQSSKSGAALQQFTIKQLRALQIPTPPLTAQESLADQLDNFAEESKVLRGVAERKLVALEELKKSLLHQAFTGQLTAKSTDQQLEAVA